MIKTNKKHAFAFNSLSMQRIYNQISSFSKCNGNFSDYTCTSIITNVRYAKNFAAIDLLLCPHRGTFNQIQFNFVIYIGEKYPYQTLYIFSRNLIYHPNINFGTKQIILDVIQNWKNLIDLQLIIKNLKLLCMEPILSCIPKNIENITSAIEYQERHQDINQQFFKKIRNYPPLRLQDMLIEEEFENLQMCDLSKKKQYIKRNINDQLSLLNEEIKLIKLN